MKTKIIIGVLLFIYVLGIFSRSAHAVETYPISFSETTKTIHAFGRVTPDFGNLQVEKALSYDQVDQILVGEGDVIKTGTPIIKLKSPCKAKVKNCTILAVHSGVVGEVLRFKDSYVKPDDGLISVFHPRQISIRLDVPVGYLRSIKLGQKIPLTDASKDQVVNYISEVVEILPSVGLADTTRGVRLKFITPVESIILTTMLDAQIKVPFNGQGAKIPTKALSFYRAKHFVIKKVNDKYVPVQVLILSETDKHAWIQAKDNADLQEGDQILSSNSIFYIKSLMEAKK